MMKMKFQKWVAALISFVMIGIVFSMLPMTSLTASAICSRKDGFDKSKYTLTGNMAEDVADCIENAGADSSIVGHGGTVADFESVMRKKGAVPVSSPQTGDLVFFTYSHVEIVTKVENGTVYCAGGNNGGTGNYKTNYCAGERKLYATPRLYLRPNYSRINPDPPSYSNLQVNKSLIFVGEEITFTASSDTATGFTIGIDNETSRYITQEMPNGSLTLTFNEPGQYGAYVTSYNPYGYCDSSWISFTVAAPVNLGDNFYARIKNQSSGWYFTNNNGNVEGQEAIDSDSQIWKFERQSDGSYKIFSKIDGIMDVYASAKDGNATNVQLWSEHGGNNQKYYIYRLDDAYYIKPLCTDLVVDMALNEYPGNVAVWAKGDDWAPQKFDIIKQIKGDLNGDTNITLTDLIPLQKHLLLRTNLTTEQSALADLNEDGIINVIDLMLLKRTLINP